MPGFGANIAWLVLCLYFEARGEPVAGQIAVGHVILNRVVKDGISVEDVVKKPYQFSWLNPGTRRPVVDDVDAFVTSMRSAYLLAAERLEGKTLEHADHYFATYIQPPVWSKSMKLITEIGQHRFFRSK